MSRSALEMTDEISMKTGDGRWDRLTIIVPTYNRSGFLLRLLRYYRSCGAPFPLVLLDSSSDTADHPELEPLIHVPPVTYLKYEPGILPTAKLDDGVHRVTTPYVVLWADDDLMVPRTLEAAVGFLDAHPDFSVVHGYSGLFQVTNVNGRPVLSALQPYSQRSYTEGRAAQRLLQYLQGNTGVVYSVHRTPNLRHNFEQCRVHEFGYTDPVETLRRRIHRSDIWVEQLLTCLSVIQGKVQRLDGLYMMRERHAGIDSWEENHQDCDLFDWVTSASFSSASAKFCACLGDALARQDGLSPSEARAVVKQAFWAGLANGLSRKWQARYGQNGVPGGGRLREAARRIPGVRGAYRAVRSRLLGRERTISLEALLHRSSRYYADFMPMYHAVVEAPGDGVRHEPMGVGEPSASAAVR